MGGREERPNPQEDAKEKRLAEETNSKARKSIDSSLRSE
jgi:hypothetical protein